MSDRLRRETQDMGIQDRAYYQEEEAWNPRVGSTRSMVTTIIIINVAVFVIDMFTPVSEGVRRDGSIDKSQWLSNALAVKTDLLQKPWNAWQLLTCGFAHASITSSSSFMHIGINMLTLFFLGRPVEQHLGSREFLKFYLVAIVFSSLIWVLWHAIRGDVASAVGASGAVTAVVMLFIFNFPHQTLLLMGIVPMKAWVVGVMLIGFNVLSGFNSTSQIAVEGHLAGALFAWLYFHFKWKFTWLRFDWAAERLSRKPRLKVHRPDRKAEVLQEKADAVLQKVHREGEASLTRQERKVLEQYSRQLRDKRP